MRGDPVELGFIGGSNTDGRKVKPKHYYYNQFAAWLNEAFPVVAPASASGEKKHDADGRSAHAAISLTRAGKRKRKVFGDSCQYVGGGFHHVARRFREAGTDALFVETAINDTPWFISEIAGGSGERGVSGPRPSPLSP